MRQLVAKAAASAEGGTGAVPLHRRSFRLSEEAPEDKNNLSRPCDTSGRPLTAAMVLPQNRAMTKGRLNLSFDAFHDADSGMWVATSTEARITTEAPSRDA
jgi:hypothetical protein